MLFNGDFLEGLEIDRSPVFNGWLTAQRRRFRGCHAACSSISSKSVPDDEAFELSGEVAAARAVRSACPRDAADRPRRRGRIREGEEHVAATARLFEAEGLDSAPIRERMALGQDGRDQSWSKAARKKPRRHPPAAPPSR